MLPSSKLLPVTIVGIAAVLSLRAYAFVTTVPSLAALQSGTAQMLAAASAIASNGVIAQAQAAEKGAEKLAERAGPKPAAAAAQPVSPTRSNRPSPASAAALSMPGTLPAPVALVVQEAPATGDVATASPAAPAAPAPSPSDLAALGRSPAEERESQTAAREAIMAAAEKRLSERVAELVVVQQRLQGIESGLKERDQANWTGLVKLYEGMKPREAATIFNSLEKPVLIEILDRMKPAKASPILASMDAERARQVTADLATRRTVATTN
jgi:flagellar motility protein MotE (MotC chaperone)